MNAFLVRGVLPLIFAAAPLVLTLGLLGAIPADAREFFWLHMTRIDWIILAAGSDLLVWQTLALWIGLATASGSGNGTDLAWLRQLSAAVEWFPLMGLLGTVISILQTLANLAPGTPVDEVIKNYSPALTATGSGLVAALSNLFPLWMGNLGLLLIQPMANGPEANPGAEG